MLTIEQKKEIVAEYGKEFGKGEKDSGNAAVQVALLTHNINTLKTHFEKHIHDYHSNRGLLKMIGTRKSLLRYVLKKDSSKYGTLIKKLGLRK
ncbi:30S ribosomal protein S15 [Halobacteriovorax marinus]|uniref:Small ribosomal subunit protein uS15 n=1 Tax=Halobacteriovorax marinus TaxID=97084 RepID=A0A1Y5FF55_9BACT|nr:30S ribosomal protein S15 [Halobacteriovorax marinus]